MEYVILEFKIFDAVIAFAEIVNNPEFDNEASPDKLTGLAWFDPSPIKILPAFKVTESLLLNVFQSVEVNRPFDDADAFGVTTPQSREPGAQSGSKVCPGW